MLLSAAQLALLGLAALPAAAAESVLGIYVFHRHGDRSTKAYKPTKLTALGADQVFQSGAYFRSRYVAANATAPVVGASHDLAVLSQLAITAPLDNVLQSSASFFAQGLYPPAGAAAEQTLANGSVVEAPLGGYQTIPVNLVSSAASGNADSEDSTWLQGGSGCAKAIASSNGYLLSPEYQATLASTAGFYQDLLPVVNTTFASSDASFKNAYSIFDYVHVATIHNKTIPSDSLLTDDVLFQLQTRADQHEWGLAYNASDPVRAVAGAVLAGEILEGLNATVQAARTGASSAPRLSFQFGAYASFMSFFGLAQLPAASPDFYGIVDYAASIVFELVTNASTAAVNASAPLALSDISVRFLLSNGSAALTGGLTPYPLFGSSDELMPWPTFLAEMDSFAIRNTSAWNLACGNDSPAETATTTHCPGSSMSLPVAGVIGAMVTLAVILGLEALVLLVGGLRLAKKAAPIGDKEAPAAGSPLASAPAVAAPASTPATTS